MMPYLVYSGPDSELLHNFPTPLLPYIWSKKASRRLYRSLTPNTHQSYNTVLAKFHQFRTHYDLAKIWPVPTNHLVHFIAYLSINNLSYRTICIYISAMSYHHKILGALDNTRHFIVTKSLEGVRRSVGVNKDIPRLISIQLFTKIIPSLKSVCRSLYESHFLRQHTLLTFWLITSKQSSCIASKSHLSKSVGSVFGS